jgi:hypothetical protein
MDRKVAAAEERRIAVVEADTGCSQRSVDLFLAMVADDTEKRTVAFWLGKSLFYSHKYADRLPKYAEDSKRANDRWAR